MAILMVSRGARIADAVARAADGDVIEVVAGEYPDDFAEIRKNITIRGIGGMAHIVANRPPPNGKAALVISGTVTLDHIEISDVAVVDNNGAAVRFEGGHLTLVACHFHDNQMGLLTSYGIRDARLTIRDSDLSRNGTPVGNAHNLYVNDIAVLDVENSYFHHAVVGHQFKSRALVTRVIGCRFADHDGSGSYSLDLPNGGIATLVGNTFEQGPRSDNPAMIAYGEEGNLHPETSLTLADSTVVNHLPGGFFLWNAAGAPATMTNTAVWGLTAERLVSGEASITGTTFLPADPGFDTSAPWAALPGPQPTPEPPPQPLPEPAPEPAPAPAPEPAPTPVPSRPKPGRRPKRR